MTTEREGVPTPSATAQAEAAGAAALRDPSAALHGRLLNVSRMATIGEIAAGVAHELNQPLTAIANYAQACERLLARGDSDPAQLREALRQITAQTTRAAEIIRRLRALARGQQSAHSATNINDLVRELQDLLQTDAVMHGAHLSLDLAPALPLVAVDAGQVQQVVLNFVRNSLEALTQRPARFAAIVIRTSLTPQNDLELAVSDNGPGLALTETKRVFDPFFSTKENGTGLGLAISSSIARAHGGSVGYRPNPGGGACFYLLLPAQPAD